MKKLRFAFAGFRHGHILSLYRQVAEHPDCEIAAAAEEDAATREQLAESGRAQITHDDIAAMLRSVPCDVVAVGDCYGRRGAIAIAAYSYMALIPLIQPPFMKLLTTKKERAIVMENPRKVSKVERVIFPILVTLLVTLIVPDAAPLVGFLMLGNLFNVSGVTERLSKTAQNELINIITIFLGVSVGATANAANFLSLSTLKIIVLGLCAFILATCGGLLLGKLMCFLTRGKINPLIGSAGVSAVPMAARVSQREGQKANPSNFLLMHAMGPNVAGVIGSAIAAGFLISMFGG